nr:hypothetical protein [uncultured Chryseobacterium sp.]
MLSKQDLKLRFENGDIPKQEEFWEWQDSYWHKDEKLPADKIDYDFSEKADLVDGKIPASQLPSYVDDVLEFSSFSSLPSEGEKGKIYVLTDTNNQYRWSGSEYIQINFDANIMTINTNQSINGRKEFITDGGNTWDRNNLMTIGKNGNKAGLTFYSEGMDVGQLQYDGNFHFIHGNNANYQYVKSYGYRKMNSSDDYLLTGGGGHLPKSDFEISELGSVNLLSNSETLHLSTSDYSNSDNSKPGEITVLSPLSWNAYKFIKNKEYTLGNNLTAQIEVYHEDVDERNFTFYFYSYGNSKVTYNHIVKPNIWTKLVSTALPNATDTTVLIGFASNDMTAGTKVKYRNIQLEEGSIPSTYTPSIEELKGLDYSTGINNGSDTRTNKTWFDYNWANTGGAGSVINFSGLPGGHYSTELFASYLFPDVIGIRTRNGDSKVWNEPRFLWHDQNFNPNDYWKTIKINALYNSLNSDLPVAVLNDSNAQVILSGGLLASDAYTDKNHIPSNGIYSKGNIKTGSSFVGGAYFSDRLTGGQVINAVGTVMTIGNPNLPAFTVETADTNLIHYRSGFGKGIIWDQHNFNPDSKISTNDADDNYISKKVTSQNNFNGISGYTSGIYRAENYGGGVNHIYTPMLHMGGKDTMTQLQIQYSNGTTQSGELSYRGGFNNSWDKWRTAWDNVNFDPETKITGENNATTLGFDGGSSENQPYVRHNDGVVKLLITDNQLKKYITLNTDQVISGKKEFTTSFENYTPDGLFNKDARPLKTNTPGGNKLLFGYKDYGAGQYYPRIGFTANANWSLGAIDDYFTIGINNDGTETLKITSKEAYINGHRIWNEGNFTSIDTINWNQAFNWGNHSTAGYTTQTWINSQDYATSSLVEESIDKLTIEITNPDTSINAENKFVTILITDNIQSEQVEWKAFHPEQYISVINIGSKDINLNLQGKTFDRIRPRETSEYYVNKKGELIKKGNYKETTILIH